MRKFFQNNSVVYGFAAAMFVFLSGVLMASQALAVDNAQQGGQRLVTIHDRGNERSILTREDTLGKALEAANISVEENDVVEPGLNEELVANQYEVNIYRARPVMIVDGSVKQKVMSAYQTPKQIAAQAEIELQDEDISTMQMSQNFVSDGAGLQMVIDRATEFTLVQYGKKSTAYTQAETVGDMLEEKGIELKTKDKISVSADSPMKKGMKVEIWRDGKQVVTEEKDVDFEVEQIQDMDREVGYKEVKTPGVKGKKTVSYEVMMKNGKEVSRKEVRSVVTKQPKKQVEIVGAKPSFGGDFAAALAKLRSCEGGYDSWNPAGPYYGAYQFDQQTWNSVSDAPYGEASNAEQDAAARALYERRGWSPWPHCGASLPDTYR